MKTQGRGSIYARLDHTPLDPIKRFRIGLKQMVNDDEVSEEQARVLRKMAVGAFAQAANNGMAFQDCLTVVLNTGLHFAVKFFSERDREEVNHERSKAAARVFRKPKRLAGPSPVQVRTNR